MKTIQRVYPIRKTAKAWKIPIFVTHLCSESCSYQLERVVEGEGVYYTPVQNPDFNPEDGKCSNFGKKLRATGVKLKNFDLNNPLSYHEPILNPDEVVICDTRFDVIISYPLRGPVKISMLAPSEKGFTRKELIESLKHIYDFIYREEERTATPTVYEYREICSDCEVKSVVDFLKKCKLDERCSICYHLGKKVGSTLPCGHKFHQGCIMSWLETQNTCPLCRNYVKSCVNCGGLGFITHTRENVVIPLGERGYFYNRNTTDGIFGIWGHDFDDLLLDGLFYDHQHRLLRIHIGS